MKINKSTEEKLQQFLERRRGQEEQGPPANENQFKQKGDIYFKIGRFEEACQMYTQALSVQEEGAIYSNRCLTYIKLNKLQEAMADA